MKRVAICLALLLALGGIACSQGAPPPAASSGDLSKPCVVRLGQLYALSLQNSAEMFMGIEGSKDPLLVSFDIAGSMLGVEILGPISNPDEAKEAVEELRSKVLARALAVTNMALRANVTEEQLTISYVNSSTLNTVIIFQHGMFLIS